MRRRRFIVTFDAATTRFDERIEVMGYDAVRVREWAERTGATVLDVRPKPRAAKGSRTRARKWVLDQSKLAEIIEFLGIKRPVYVTVGAGRRQTGSCSTCYGWQLPKNAPAHLRRQHIVHYIIVSGYESPAEASRTLWHELAHAMQGERILKNSIGYTHSSALMPLIKHFRQEADAYVYRQRPCEIEAREYEAFASEIAACVWDGGAA